MGVFDEYERNVYQHVWAAGLLVRELHGGVPQDPKVIQGWLAKAFSESPKDKIRDLVRRTLVDLGEDIDAETISDSELDEMIEKTAERKTNGFYRLDGQPAVAGRHVKAMIKEAANIQWPKRRWGPSNKGTRSFFAEHVFVDEYLIPLGVGKPDGIDQRQVNTFRGTSFNYEEYVAEAKVNFTVVTDYDFDYDDWATLWVTAQRNGLGASRSQGCGQFTVERWEKTA